MRLLSRAVFFLMVLLSALPAPAHSEVESKGKGSFMVTGHIYKRWREPSDIGADQEFIDQGIPFINRIRPDFLVLTGDLIYNSKDLLREQYKFVVQNVFSKIETKIYCLAGNHDTWWPPDYPAIEIFEELINPLRFSFVQNGALFLFLSLYEPFPHIEGEGVAFPLERVWDSFDTQASRSFLDTLKQELRGDYTQVFVFVHIPPISDYPIGYYWSNFLIPLFSSLNQDVFIFSTFQTIKQGLLPNQVVRYKNLRFYCWASYPDGSYMVNFDRSRVKVTMMQGASFVPTPTHEVEFQPTTRWSMLRCSLRRLWSKLEVRINSQLHDREHRMRESDPSCAKCKIPQLNK